MNANGPDTRAPKLSSHERPRRRPLWQVILIRPENDDAGAELDPGVHRGHRSFLLLRPTRHSYSKAPTFLRRNKRSIRWWLDAHQCMLGRDRPISPAAKMALWPAYLRLWRSKAGLPYGLDMGASLVDRTRTWEAFQRRAGALVRPPTPIIVTIGHPLNAISSRPCAGDRRDRSNQRVSPTLYHSEDRLENTRFRRADPWSSSCGCELDCLACILALHRAPGADHTRSAPRPRPAESCRNPSGAASASRWACSSPRDDRVSGRRHDLTASRLGLRPLRHANGRRGCKMIADGDCPGGTYILAVGGSHRRNLSSAAGCSIRHRTPA